MGARGDLLGRRRVQGRSWNAELGIPGQIVAIVDDANNIAKVEVSGVKRNINDSATFSGLSADGAAGAAFARQLAVLARPADLALGFSPDGRCADVLEALGAARRMGLLTLGLAGGDGGRFREAGLDFCFVVPTTDQPLVQEIHETLYHVLWELVHIFFEHEGVLR